MASIDGNSVAAIIAAGFSGMATLVTALNRRTARTTEGKIDKTAETVESHSQVIENIPGQIDEVHQLVNSQLGEQVERGNVAEARNVVLESALTDANVAVPDVEPGQNDSPGH